MTENQELIPIGSDPIGGRVTQTCDARRLWKYLEVKQEFANWIKNRINEYGFTENQDYVCLTDLSSKTGSGGHNKKDYHITLDMAKELSMVERNEKGKEARRYFIRCESELFERLDITPTVQQPKSLASLAKECKAAMTITKAFGFSGNQALLSANTLVHSVTGVYPLEMMEQTHLISPDQELYLIPSEIGEQLGVSAQRANKLLQEIGFQAKIGDRWTLTEKGKEYGVIMDTKKRHNDGTPVQQVKWYESIIPILQASMNESGGQAA